MSERIFLELGDAARLLGLTVATVRIHARSGRLVPAASTPRGVRLFRMADVNAFRQRRKGERLSADARARRSPPRGVRQICG